MFPTEAGDKNGNVLPGTVVENRKENDICELMSLINILSLIANEMTQTWWLTLVSKGRTAPHDTLLS